MKKEYGIIDKDGNTLTVTEAKENISIENPWYGGETTYGKDRTPSEIFHDFFDDDKKVISVVDDEETFNHLLSLITGEPFGVFDIHSDATATTVKTDKSKIGSIRVFEDKLDTYLSNGTPAGFFHVKDTKDLKPYVGLHYFK